MKRVLVVAGGTGGHVYPALAIAELLKAKGVNILWLGTHGRMEEKIVPAFFPIQYINIKALRGNGIKAKLLAPWHILRAVIQAHIVIKAYKPDLLVTMGGFVCGPAGVAAKLCGVPLLIHEQNATAGMTNRLLARVAGCVLQAFPGAFPVKIKAETVGNPVRSALLKIAPPAARLAAHTGKPRLLILGGSQGAHFINQVVAEYLLALPKHQRPAVRHQTGEADCKQIQQQYQALGDDCCAVAFIEDMAGAYAWADLVLCRAGALTVSELAAVGIASILVPLPSAVDDHQRHNAQYLTDAGAGVLMRQSAYTAVSFEQTLTQLLENKDQLLEMAQKAREKTMSDATVTVVSYCEQIAKVENKASYT